MNREIDMEQFCEDLVKKKGVLLLPGMTYEYTEPYFRMGYGRKDFAESLQKFEEYLTEQKYI